MDEQTVIERVADMVTSVETRWRSERESDDDQGVAEWALERREREDQMTRALRWGRRFDAAAWRSETRQALMELAALCLAQVASLDRASPTTEETSRG